MASPRARSRQSFPKGTCWLFHSGRYCGGCKFEHQCFKYDEKHPASQCSAVNQQSHALPKNGSSKGGQAWISSTRVPCFPYKEYLVSGFSCGFRINFVSKRHSFESSNLKSALEQPHIIVSKLNKNVSPVASWAPFPNRFFKIFVVPTRHSS